MLIAHPYVWLPVLGQIERSNLLRLLNLPSVVINMNMMIIVWVKEEKIIWGKIHKKEISKMKYRIKTFLLCRSPPVWSNSKPTCILSFSPQARASTLPSLISALPPPLSVSGISAYQCISVHISSAALCICFQDLCGGHIHRYQSANIVIIVVIIAIILSPPLRKYHINKSLFLISYCVV